MRLAKANIVRGKLEEAEMALAEGMRAFDSERASLTDEGRLSTSDESWQLFDTAVQLAIHRGDHERAFAMAERARARSLVEQRLAADGPSLEQAQRRLGPGEVVIAVNQFDDELAIWAISRRSVKVVTRPLNRADTARLLARQQLEIIRESAAPEANGILYDELIRPLAAELRSATRVIVIPDATFQDVSFAALWNRSRNRFFVEEATVTGAPSFWALARSEGTAVRRSNDALILSMGGASDASVETIANTYGQRSWLRGNEATRTRFFADAAKTGIVHLAARSNRNDAFPLLSGVMLADEPGRRHSGRLLGRDVAAQSLAQTHLVVLDEVESGRGNRGEGTLSMARAFMAAGVPAVLGTLPGADENAARDLMIGFHREMSTNISAGRALATVQRNAIEQNGRRLGAWTALVLYGSDR